MLARLKRSADSRGRAPPREEALRASFGIEEALCASLGSRRGVPGSDASALHVAAKMSRSVE